MEKTVVNLIPTIVETSRTEARVELPELVVPYAVRDFEQWGDEICPSVEPGHVCGLPGRRTAKEELLARFPADKDGRLFSRPLSVFWHQPHNWPEFTWCCYLAESGFPVAQIVYENWRASELSSAFVSCEKGGKGKYALGTAVLRSVLLRRFFSEYSALIEANRDMFKGRRNPHHSSVDVFAARSGEIGFFEMKRDEGTRAERVLPHQDLALALLALAAARIWPDGQGPVVRAGFVRFSDRSPSGERGAVFSKTFRLPI